MPTTFKDPYGLMDSGLPPELVAQLVGGRNKQKIADALMASSMKPVENMGGPGAVVSWTQGLAQIADALAARKGRGEADAIYGDVAKQASAGRQAAIDAYTKQKMGVPGVTPLTPNDDEGNPMPVDPGVKADPAGAIAQGAANPYLANSPFLKMEQASYDRALNREDQQKFLKEQKQMQLEQRAHDIQMQHQARLDQIRAQAEEGRITREEADKRAAASREEMMRLAASLRAPTPPQQGTIVDPTNPKQMILIDTKSYQGGGIGAPGVIGVAGKEPGAAKQAEKVDAGRETVSSLVNTLRTHYDALKEGGDITSKDQGVMSNAKAAVMSTGVGQLLSRVTNPSGQSNRDMIAQTRPLLLNAIKEATGMTAKQMDSNAELKMYLAAATDPAIGYEANVKALENLDRLYGLGLSSKSGAAPAAPASVPTATGPNGQKLYLRNGQWVPQ